MVILKTGKKSAPSVKWLCITPLVLFPFLFWATAYGGETFSLAGGLHYMFDSPQTERFHIFASFLPPEGNVINKPAAFNGGDNNIILATSLIIGLLFLLICILIINIVQRRRAMLALQKSEARYYDLYENAPDMYYSLNVKTGNIRECNNAFVRATGYSKEEILGRPIFEFYHGDSVEEARKSFEQFDQTSEIRNAERQVKCKDGRIIDVSLNVSAERDKNNNIIYTRSIWRDITERKQLEQQISTLAITDQLTGLYNRRGFLTLSEQQISVAERTKKGLLLLFADLDGLKEINDNSGHKIGDDAIIEAAAVYKEVFRKMDIIARIGGDEFAILVPEASWKYAELVESRLFKMIAIHNARSGRVFNLSMSIGSAYYDPERPVSLDELMARADISMYEQKKKKNLG